MSHQEFESLREIILSNLGVDVLEDKRRKRNIIDAKKIYAYILSQKGYGCSRIGNSIRMHHSNIIHYLKDAKYLIETDKELGNNYKMCKSSFDGEYDPLYYMSDIELKKEIVSLRVRIISLSSSLESAESEIESLNDRDQLRHPLHKMVKERTRVGTEEDVLVKLNKFYNGVYDY
jgi:hypothetical protein